MVILPLAGVRFKPERVYVRSLDVLIITPPNGNDGGLTVIVGTTPLPLTDTLVVVAPPPMFVMLPL
jgi:hypothetical protein